MSTYQNLILFSHKSQNDNNKKRPAPRESLWRQPPFPAQPRLWFMHESLPHRDQWKEGLDPLGTPRLLCAQESSWLRAHYESPQQREHTTRIARIRQATRPTRVQVVPSQGNGSDSEDENANDEGYYDEERHEYKRYLMMIVGKPLSFSSWINGRPRWWTEVDKILYKPNKIEHDYHDQQWY